MRRLVDAVAARYAGTRPDVLRLAIPPRHAGAEKSAGAVPLLPVIEPVDPTAWGRYQRGEQFLEALRDGRAARAVWQALPGERWCERIAEAAAAAVTGGYGVLAIVPDQRDVDALLAAVTARIADAAVVALSAGLGPSARYRRWLSVLRGHARVVIGTRSAVFAPVDRLGLVIVWDDGDDTLAEPRAPYPHAREVAMLRAHQLRCAALIGGYARTAEAQALVRSGWAHDLVAARPVVRACAPRVVALDDGGYARTATPRRGPRGCRRWRCGPPGGALERGARCWCRFPAADTSVGRLRAVPHHRPLPALHGAACALRAGRRRRGLPLVRAHRHRPAVPPLRRRRDPRRGDRRPAHRRGIGPGFPGIAVITSAGDSVHAEIPPGPALVVATPGAEPRPRTGTAPRCCWTPGRCWAARTCGPPRTPCAAGWPPPPWCTLAPTAEWSRSSPRRRSPPCRR